tara:strand:+ start:252 stop:707 length:456 start_codon:yes stop_codon:yes gene_type:complete
MTPDGLNPQGRPARKTCGATAELMVATELMAHGFSVSWPVGDVDPYDLISDSGERLQRVQVKGAFTCSSRGTWRITFTKGQKTKRRYTAKECDSFVAVIMYPGGAAYYVVPVEHIKSFRYTFFPAGQHPRWPDKWRTCKLEPYRDRWDLLR